MGENDLVSREAENDVTDTNVGDMISRRAVMDALLELYEYQRDVDPSWAADLVRQGIFLAEKKIDDLPSAQPEIIRCKDCKHWTQSMGKMKGYGLGRCDFHDADLVAYNGFCYWAERRTDDGD